MTYHRFTRQEFYDLVWSEPLSHLSKRLNISDVAIGKLCRHEQIPHPPVGYWAKLAAGKKVTKIDLPPRGVGMSNLIEFGRDLYGSHRKTPGEILEEPIPQPPEFPEAMEAVRDRALSLVEKAPIRKSLSNPHPVIAELLARREKRRSLYGLGSDGPIVDRSVEKRRLQILNGLFVALSYCNCKPSYKENEKNEVFVRVGNVLMMFMLGTPDEILDENVRRPIRKNSAQDRLVLKISWWNEPTDIQLQWEDKETTKLEDQLKDIVVGMLVASEGMYRASLMERYNYEIEQRREAQTEIQRKKEESDQIERALAAKLKREKRRQLVVEMLSWKRAMDLREFIAASLAKAHASGDDGIIEKTVDWAVWANAEADEIDPLHH